MYLASYNNIIITANDFSNEKFKTHSDNNKLFCLDCGDPVVFKYYNNKQSHFAHISRECSSPFSEPESIEHETGKKSIFDWISNHFNQTELEKKIHETNQRSDVFINETKTALEFQCSPIQEKTWKERCQLYDSAGVHHFWILGYSMHSYYRDDFNKHKLNNLEKSILNQYGKIVYYDVLTKQFVFLLINSHQSSYSIGTEYFFKPSEVYFKDSSIFSKFDYFINNQIKRKNYALKETKKEGTTRSFIKEIKREFPEAKRELATPKQISYIKYLLYKTNQKIPYKLSGLKKEQADEMIKRLKQKIKETT